MADQPIALVAEDEPVLRMLAAEILEDAGFDVQQAGNAAEALDALDLFPAVALLMTDVQMPGEMDGFALAREVARRLPNLSIIVCSGRMRPEPGDLPAGAHFITKPFTSDTISLVLQQFDLA